MVSALERPSIQRKAKEVEELKNLINGHPVMGIASLHKVRANQIKELAKRFRSIVKMRVAKKLLLKRAISASSRPGIGKIADHLTGPSIILLTEINPFRLRLLLERNKMKVIPKSGDVAQGDIVIRAGNTGLPPGPAISELSGVGIRTKIESGSVWVIRDTVVAEEGALIDPKVASVLSKLKIRALEVGLEMVAAYEDGLVLSSDKLAIDIDEIRGQFEEAHRQAFNLSLNVAHPTKETLNYILVKAYMSASNLAVNSAYPAPEVTQQLIYKAHSNISAIASILSRTSKGFTMEV